MLHKNSLDLGNPQLGGISATLRDSERGFRHSQAQGAQKWACLLIAFSDLFMLVKWVITAVAWLAGGAVVMHLCHHLFGPDYIARASAPPGLQIGS